jgi:hypothetical protein
MGPAPSELERYILAKAAGRPRVYFAEVLAGYYGWRPLRPLEYEGGLLLFPGSQRFSLARIGKHRYAKTKAELSRVCNLLAALGLVNCLTSPGHNGAAVEITGKGREWLAANTRTNLPGS